MPWSPLSASAGPFSFASLLNGLGSVLVQTDLDHPLWIAVVLFVGLAFDPWDYHLSFLTLLPPGRILSAEYPLEFQI